jgi:hypothetical protein
MCVQRYNILSVNQAAAIDVGLTGDEEFANLPQNMANPQTVINVDTAGTGGSGDNNKTDGGAGDTTGCFIEAAGQ